MKRLLPLMLAVVLMLSACHNDPVDRTAIDNMVAELDSVKTLYDGGDYLGAAKAFDALRNGYDSSAQMNYKTALEYRNRVLLPMFEWMGLPGGTGHIIDWCIPWSSIYDESQWKKRDRDYQVDLIRWNVDRTLEVMFRNSLYQYYREQEDAGRDVGLLEELPYVHDKTWKEFTRTLCMKYRIDRADVTFKGGKKLMVENHESTWTWQEAALLYIAPMDLAVSADEVGYILHIDEEKVPLNVAWVNKKTGNTVKNYYRSDITVSLENLETGEIIELCNGSATPNTGPATNFNSPNVGRHSMSDAFEAIENGAYPVLGRYIHIYSLE